MADNTAVLILASNWMMRAWEMGNEAECWALTTPELRMVIYLVLATVPAYKCVETWKHFNCLLPISYYAIFSDAAFSESVMVFQYAGYSRLRYGRHWLRQRLGDSQEYGRRPPRRALSAQQLRQR